MSKKFLKISLELPRKNVISHSDGALYAVYVFW